MPDFIDPDKSYQNTEMESGDAETPSSGLNPAYPFRIAESFAEYQSEVFGQLCFHREDWFRHVGSHYQLVDQNDLRADAYRWLDRHTLPDGNPLRVSQTLVNNVMDALRSAVRVPIGEMPRWLGYDFSDRPAAHQLIAFRNGLLDVGAWLRDPAVSLLPHHADWFSANVLPFDYDSQAECPQWETFIEQAANGDDTWITALAMMFGYLLTHDTSQQKIFLFQGAPRAGKGTICRVLRELIGSDNVSGPSLPSLCGTFGLSPLVGKSLAIIPDAHLGRGSDATRVLEILKSLSGEDAVDVNRKHRESQTMRLPVRFLIACNTLLDLPDPSGALAGRMILFPFVHSYQGKEDHGLTDRLLTELPGVLQWSLAGLRALRTRGRLLQPASGDQARQDFARLSAPIRGFIDDRLEVTPAGVLPVAAAYDAWRSWCEQEGHLPGSTATFGSKLLSALPGITKSRIGSRQDRAWSYKGLRLTCIGGDPGHARTRDGGA